MGGDELLGRGARIAAPGEPLLQMARMNLALNLEILGDLEGAEPFYFEAQEMLYRVYGDEHPEIAQTLDNELRRRSIDRTALLARARGADLNTEGFGSISPPARRSASSSSSA